MSSRQPTIQALAVLSEMLTDPSAPRYGLDLSREVELKAGTIYPLLARLEGLGWLESFWEDVEPEAVERPRRRMYRLTDRV